MPILTVEHLRKSYGEGTDRHIVIDDVSFALERGECYGLLGPNGAGKTTTLRLCLGLTAPDSGQITWVGHSVPRDARRARLKIGVVPQMEDQVADIGRSMKKGSLDALKPGEFGIVLGKELARNLGGNLLGEFG
jgi:ABC-type multidrug transport system ATPase subunit